MSRLIAIVIVLAFLAPLGAHAEEPHVVIILIDGLPAYLLDDPDDRLLSRSPRSPLQMGDLVLVAKEGYSFELEPTGDEFVVPNSNPTAGTHGFLSTEPKMNAIFVASGAGIKVGERVKAVANVDVAPTMAHILGVSLKDASGRVLTECFAGAR